jgi:hypothetical protein
MELQGLELIVARNLSAPSRLERHVHSSAQRHEDAMKSQPIQYLVRQATTPKGRFGSVANAGPAFVAGEGTPHALIIVPVGDSHESH